MWWFGWMARGTYRMARDPRLQPPRGGASRFEKFSERARRALSVAHEEVFRFNQMEIGTEHVLMGLIEDLDSMASKVLGSLGAEPSDVRERLEAAIIRGPAPWPRDIGLSQGTKRIIELAVEEARNRRHTYIGTGHLLVGVMREGEGLAARVLENLGVSVNDVGAAVRMLVEQDPTGRQEGVVSPRERQSASVHGPGPRTRFAKFSERARRVLSVAQEEAQRHHHNYIGTEHILLALAREEDGLAARVLVRLGLEPSTVRSDLERLIGQGTSQSSQDPGLTAGAKKAIELTVDEASRMDHDYIGTEHLLIGIIREDGGMAAGVLKSHGIALDAVRAEVRAFLRQDPPPAAGQ